MRCEADIQNHACHTCAKGSNFTIAIVNIISNLHEIAQNFTYLQKL